ncbi:MAG: GNAT family N-acetyltransferase [Acidimicrobiaceae bacterium]|nr:GNAT family N-acetyltransferase [Acidimicrobiaceae bacterium]
MLIRRRTPDDLAALSVVLLRVRELDGYPVYLPGDDPVAFITLPGDPPAWVVEWEGRVVGHVALSPVVRDSVRAVLELAGAEPPFAHVTRLFVDPDARGRGCASALLDEARAHAHREGATASLDVVSRDGAAIALYDSRGWRRVGESVLDLPGFPRFDEFVYVEPPARPDID